ncbi:hypothetical protein AAG570_010060 [Ranatra chinensis]|uniref:Uncharacterized protein n=1 Tax=Ranatra chinensis TaxID=642074 RepID=A0ABD0YXM6_9HEMI
MGEDCKQLTRNACHPFQCCGVDGVDEWGSYVGEGNVPASCCGPHRHLILNDRNLRVCKISWNKTLLHTRGCWTVIEPLISKHSLVVMGVAIGLSLCQFYDPNQTAIDRDRPKLVRTKELGARDDRARQITVLKVWTEREEGSRWPKSKTNEVESEEQPRATANPT